MERRIDNMRFFEYEQLCGWYRSENIYNLDVEQVRSMTACKKKSGLSGLLTRLFTSTNE